MLTSEKYAKLLIERIYDILDHNELINSDEISETEILSILLKDVTYQIESIIKEIKE